MSRHVEATGYRTADEQLELAPATSPEPPSSNGDRPDPTDGVLRRARRLEEKLDRCLELAGRLLERAEIRTW